MGDKDEKDVEDTSGYEKTGVQLVLATGPISRVGSGSGSTRNRTVATGFTTRKTWTVAFGPVSTGKPGPGKPGIFPPIKYLSSDRITT